MLYIYSTTYKKFLYKILKSLNCKLRNVVYETRREFTKEKSQRKEKFSSRKNESIKMYLTSE